ncbi:hypothetical protein KI387_013506, partial [Taxus chinensis]
MRQGTGKGRITRSVDKGKFTPKAQVKGAQQRVSTQKWMRQGAGKRRTTRSVDKGKFTPKAQVKGAQQRVSTQIWMCLWH